MVNKTLGNRFEREFCELLAEHGFWAHNLAQNQAGQPADILAIRDDIPVLIDCKVCSNNRFAFSRVEENQETAMHAWMGAGNERCYFALKLMDGSTYMVHSEIILAAVDAGRLNAKSPKSLSEGEIRTFPTFKEWVEEEFPC